ncbi:hypothetical protein DSECCO2_160860 [anaerobic digester metagenome]
MTFSKTLIAEEYINLESTAEIPYGFFFTVEPLNFQFFIKFFYIKNLFLLHNFLRNEMFLRNEITNARKQKIRFFFMFHL